MKKFFFLLCALIFSASLLASPVFAAQSHRTVVVEQNQIINSDYFNAGDNVTILGTINGDVYVAGGSVTIDGIVNGDIIAAGGNLDIRGKAQNVRVAGGQVTVNGTIEKNLTVFGGNITLGESAHLAGSLVAGGGSITLASPVGKGATIGGGNVVIEKSINGNLYTGAGQLILQPQAKIMGNLTYVSDNKLQLLQGATISGSITHNLPPKPQKRERLQTKNVMMGLGSVYLVFKFISLISLFVLGLILLALAPNFVRKTTETIAVKPWQSVGIGFVTLIIAPILFVILLLTVIGAPLAFIFIALYLIALYFAKLFVIFFIGQKVGGAINSKMQMVWMFLIGLIIYEIVAVIPVLGWVVEFAALLLGFGSLILTKKALYSVLKNEKLV